MGAFQVIRRTRQRKRFRFSRILQVDVLVWDAVGSDLIKFCVQSLSVGIFPVRGELFHVNIRTMVLILKFLPSMKRLSHAYARAVVQQANPKYVVTFMDNSNFHVYAEYFSSVRFIAIQNGWRFPSVPGAEPPLPHGASFNSELLCFGELDVSAYQDLQITFKSITPVGSLRNAIYSKTHEGPQVESNKFDICLISQFRSRLPGDSPMRLDFQDCCQFVKTYLATNSEKKVVIVLANSEESNPSEYKDECMYLEEFFGSEVEFVPRDDSNFGSYSLADQAEIVISSNSTAALEALARRKKTLITGSLMRKYFEESITPKFVLGVNEQYAFNERVNQILKSNSSEYWDPKTKAEAELIMPNVAGRNLVDVLNSMLTYT